jgi:signal transduction histidine kinase
VTSLHGPRAVLVLRLRRGAHEPGLVCARAAAAALGPVLERAWLLERNAARERSLVESSERRIARLGFDLHDGALQDVAVLAADLRLFREQLARALFEAESRGLLLGRIADLEARLEALDDDLREIATSFQSSRYHGRPLQDVLDDEVASFARRSDTRASLHTSGDLSDLTDSQRIAILRIVQEALSNVREHSGATEVRTSIVHRGGKIEVEVVDDGRGFSVEATLLRAARNGRLGLVGMAERVRLLGGRLEVDSRPGGPTTISATLPEWRPVVKEADAQPIRTPTPR